MIAILDYGAGNLRSVENTLGAIGCEYALVQDAAGLAGASKVILPGVGHFGQMMRTLRERDLVDPLRAAAARVPFLGICLGMQALFEASAEDPAQPGMALLPGRVERFPEAARVPHMGWNNLDARGPARLFTGSPFVYYAHSYYCPVVEGTAATTSYAGITYTAVLERGNLFGVQFHPEKSGPAGLDIVRRFVEL